MIFITVGSQKFQFNRLLKEIDRLVQENKIMPDEVFAQIGHSTYQPKQYQYKKFLDKEEFTKAISESVIVITHGGTGSIITGLKNSKKVIAVPRSVKYGEHVDDHQYEIIEQFENSNMIYAVLEITDLETAISQVKNMEFRKYESNTRNMIKMLEEYLSSSFLK